MTVAGHSLVTCIIRQVGEVQQKSGNLLLNRLRQQITRRYAQNLRHRFRCKSNWIAKTNKCIVLLVAYYFL